MPTPTCAGCDDPISPDEHAVSELATQGEETDFTGRVFHAACWPHGFHAAQIRRVRGRDVPDPGQDSTWWSVDFRRGKRPGWVHVAQSVPPPSVEWIADELNRRRAKYGKALESMLLAKGGLPLENAPRSEHDG